MSAVIRAALPCNMGKGQTRSEQNEIYIQRYGNQSLHRGSSVRDPLRRRFQLTGEQAALWLNGRFGFAKNRENVLEVKALRQLKRQGLVEITEGDEPVFEYRALTQCVLTPAKPQGVRAILSARQKELLLWLTEAGLRLTTAELVFLTEHHVAPQINLLGDRNRQNLTEAIYTQETIFDNILEAQMEHAAVRDEVVSALLRLLKKKRILLL